jgi:IS605 OrfB family transposase
MRTVRYATLPLNRGKLSELSALIRAFNSERSDWVNRLKSLDNLALLDGRGVRALRDKHVKAGYVSLHGLQARAWKLALTEASNLLDRHWQAQLGVVKDAINARRGNLTPDEVHLLFYALKSYGMLADVLSGTVPASIETKFTELVPNEKRRRSLLRWLRRRIRAMLRDNRLPVVKANRSVILDANCYSTVQKSGRWYLKVASLTPGKRIALPLSGDARGLAGNLCITLDGSKVEVHVQHDTGRPETVPQKAALSGKPLKTRHGTPLAIDVGFTEVAVDNTGRVLGQGFGKLMTTFAEARNVMGQRRNRLRAVADRARLRGDEARARRIEAKNLGTVKQSRTLERQQAAVLCHINRALGELLSSKPSVVVHEDLSRAKFKFNYGASSNRSLSNWARGVFAERLQFKSQVRGSHLVAVNPAYSSQLCPSCGFVDSKNRNGDRFRCARCAHSGAADQVAALNLLARARDARLACWMSPAQVRAVLDEQFKRRLEAAEPAKAGAVATVSGQTSDVASTATRASRGRVRPHSGESATCARMHPTTTRRANNGKSQRGPTNA